MALQLFFAWFTAWLALRFRRTMVFRALHPPESKLPQNSFQVHCSGSNAYCIRR